MSLMQRKEALFENTSAGNEKEVLSHPNIRAQRKSDPLKSARRIRLAEKSACVDC